MREINRKDVRADEFTPLTMRLTCCIRNERRAPVLFVSFLTAALLFCSSGCAPSASTGENQQSSPASRASDGVPEITDETLRKEINDVYLREVPEENGAGEPISWRFGEDEPKEFTVADKQIEGDRATIILDVKTQSAPGARSPKHLAGQIRTKWELQTGWALRRWEIVETENISMKYKNLPKPPAQNSNR